MIDFPFPEAEDRERIWRLLLPERGAARRRRRPRVPRDAVQALRRRDPQLLAGRGVPGRRRGRRRSTMRHLVRAVALEFGKHGRLTLRGRLRAVPRADRAGAGDVSARRADARVSVQRPPAAATPRRAPRATSSREPARWRQRRARQRASRTPRGSPSRRVARAVEQTQQRARRLVRDPHDLAEQRRDDRARPRLAARQRARPRALAGDGRRGRRHDVERDVADVEAATSCSASSSPPRRAARATSRTATGRSRRAPRASALQLGPRRRRAPRAAFAPPPVDARLGRPAAWHTSELAEAPQHEQVEVLLARDAIVAGRVVDEGRDGRGPRRPRGCSPATRRRRRPCRGARSPRRSP